MNSPEQERCKAIGARLKLARKERAKLSIARASERMQDAGIMCQKRTISRWEAGTTLPATSDLPLVAKVYGVTVSYFFKK